MSEIQNYLTRRTFLGRTSCGLGAAALSDLFASSPAALAAEGAVAALLEEHERGEDQESAGEQGGYLEQEESISKFGHRLNPPK